MKATRKHLHQPVELACLQLASAQLEIVTRESGRLGQIDDVEALHDFRVNVRRLRTYLQAYRNHYPKSVGKRGRKRLGNLLSATNSGRDDEVHILWLERQLELKTLPKLARTGFTALLSELAAVRHETAADELRAVAEQFEAIREELSARFTKPRQAIWVDREGESLSFGGATGRIVAELAAILKDHLAAIVSVEQEKPAHRARLAAKRLRYVLEPVRFLVRGGQGVVRQLKALQDILGDLHDLHTLEGRVRSKLEQSRKVAFDDLMHTARTARRLQTVRRAAKSGDDLALAAAAQRIAAGERRLYAQLDKRWLGTNADGFFELVDRVVGQLTRSGRAPPP
jgi:CHAD domain-containing protein